ncbi:hypothetical protein WN943_007616 [Citrus x changshan-huyou]
MSLNMSNMHERHSSNCHPFRPLRHVTNQNADLVISRQKSRSSRMKVGAFSAEFLRLKENEKRLTRRVRNGSIIWVYGMCGIGKTTLVKEVARLARQDKLFDHDEKKILIVLDNVWKHVYLDTVGIPFRDDHKDVNYC